MTAIGQPVRVVAPYHSKNGWTELIRVQVQAARIAGEHISASALKRVLDSVDRACALPAKPGWERKAAAHAELFRLLADVAGGPVTSGAAGGQARLIRDLMCAVGPGANGMISSSRRRLIDQLRAGDADGAALEMEYHLRTLRYMWLLTQPSGLTAHQSTTTVRADPAIPSKRGH